MRIKLCNIQEHFNIFYYVSLDNMVNGTKWSLIQNVSYRCYRDGAITVTMLGNQNQTKETKMNMSKHTIHTHINRNNSAHRNTQVVVPSVCLVKVVVSQGGREDRGGGVLRKGTTGLKTVGNQTRDKGFIKLLQYIYLDMSYNGKPLP